MPLVLPLCSWDELWKHFTNLCEKKRSPKIKINTLVQHLKFCFYSFYSNFTQRFEYCNFTVSIFNFNPFQPSVALHRETSHLICAANQMNGFYIECNTLLKWVIQVFVHWKVEYRNILNVHKIHNIHSTETYLEPSRTSKMQFSCKNS